jgi:hypothetical protein
MKTMSSGRRWGRAVAVVVAGALAAGVGGCGERAPKGGGAPGGQTAGAQAAASSTAGMRSAPPRATVAVDSMEPALRARIEELVRGVAFDTFPGAGDQQPLTVGKCPNCGFGPMARIEPEVNAYRNTPDSLAKGRIVARLTNLDKTRGYDKLGLPPGGTVYWYVERTPKVSRSVLYPDLSARARTRAGARAVLDTLIFEEHVAEGARGGHSWKQSVSRWLWSDEDDGAWASCVSNGCCKVGVLQ